MLTTEAPVRRMGRRLPMDRVSDVAGALRPYDRPIDRGENAGRMRLRVEKRLETGRRGV